MTEPVPFETKMAALRASFAIRARHQGEELRLLAAQVALDGSARTKIATIAHGLAGAAAIFGMPQVSSEAAELESAVAAGLANADIATQSLVLANMIARPGCPHSP